MRRGVEWPGRAGDHRPQPRLRDHPLIHPPTRSPATGLRSRSKEHERIRAEIPAELPRAPSPRREGRPGQHRSMEASRHAVDGIVMGQPILVGHHFESRHRGALARRSSTQVLRRERQGQALRRESRSRWHWRHFQRRPGRTRQAARRAGHRRGQSRAHEGGKRAIRAGKTPDKQIPALVALGFSEAAAQQAIARTSPGVVGRTYALSNNNANAARIKSAFRS